MNAAGLRDRVSYVCDSFAGLPKPRSGLSEGENYFQYQYLAVSEDMVRDHFKAYGVYNPRSVVFVKGMFVDSMGPLRDRLIRENRTLSVLRMDGDMYESTIDLLYNLYDLVDVGGLVIIDDFGWWTSGVAYGARDAIFDFMDLHGILDDEHPIIKVDGAVGYFIKARQVRVQRERYGTYAVRTNRTYKMRAFISRWRIITKAPIWRKRLGYDVE
eukprot:PhF_6_TR37217/c1_g1_i1/m.54881/K05303/K05303; O-methyltransferase